MLLRRTSESTFFHGEQKTIIVDLAKTQHYSFMKPQQSIILQSENSPHCKDAKPPPTPGLWRTRPWPCFSHCDGWQSLMGNNPWSGRAPTPGGKSTTACQDCWYGHQSDFELKQSIPGLFTNGSGPKGNALSHGLVMGVGKPWENLMAR